MQPPDRNYRSFWLLLCHFSSHINYLVLIGGALIVFGFLLAGGIPENSPTVSDIFKNIGCLILAVSGILIAIRQEAPRPGSSSITGCGAVITGVFVIIFCGGIGLVLLIDVIRELVNK